MELIFYVIGGASWAVFADWLNPMATTKRIVGLAMAVMPSFWFVLTVWGFIMMINDHVGHVGAMAFAGAGTMLMTSILWSVVLIGPTTWLTLRYLRRP